LCNPAWARGKVDEEALHLLAATETYLFETRSMPPRHCERLRSARSDCTTLVLTFVKRIQAPYGEVWLHEIKHDGFRVIARKDGARVRLYSRPANNLTDRFPLIVEALARCGHGPASSTATLSKGHGSPGISPAGRKALP
jgi:ATP dependent DNA ligase domain